MPALVLLGHSKSTEREASAADSGYIVQCRVAQMTECAH